MLGFALLAAGLFVEQQRDDLRNVANTRNRATLAAVDTELRGIASMLQAIANAHELRNDDIRGFHDYTQSLLQTHEALQNVLLHDADARQIANARLPWGTDLLKRPVESRALDAARLERRPAITDVIQAPMLGNEPGIAVRVPVIRGTRVVYVLTAVIKPAVFQRLLEQQEMPPHWVSGLVDSQGRLIARVPFKQPGTMAGDNYRQAVSKADEGWYRGRTLEGADMYTAFLKSPLTGWSLGFAIPASAVGGPVRAAWLMGGGIALSLLATGLIALWLSRRIVRPMRQLSEAATLLGSGSKPVEVSSNIEELKRVSESLVAAGEAIAARDEVLRTTEAQLRQQTAELLQADANKRHFLAVLGHELRNPLAPLRNGLAILKRSADQPVRSDVQTMMERQIGQLTRLIDDLLDVQRIDRGQLELRREALPIDDLVRNAIETVKPALEAKGQFLDLRRCQQPLYVDGDFVRLTQVFLNLLTNASKYSPPGAGITVEISEDAGRAVLKCKDTGSGFDPCDARRIFDMFVRLDSSSGRSTGGLGIGLTIAKSIVALHGGSIEAASEGPGRGACFTVLLPLANAPSPHADADPSPYAGGEKRRVLVVDDNTDAADSLAQMLALEGYEVQVTYAGAPALEAAERFKPEVAFLDLDMPGMSGFELVSALRRMPWGGKMKIYAVTGMGQKSDLARTLSAGFDGHLTKPASPDTVIRLAAGTTDDLVLKGTDGIGEIRPASVDRAWRTA